MTAEGYLGSLGRSCTHCNTKMDNQQGPIYSTWNSMLCASLDGKEAWGRMDTCVCMAESLLCSPEAITTLLISYNPTQNRKFEV